MNERAPSAQAFAELERENRALMHAIRLLHELSNLVRSTQELSPTCYALLTGVTAGVGLGMNRAAIFQWDPNTDGGRLQAIAAVGPRDAEEADRIWRAIEEEGADLEALYEAGQRIEQEPGGFALACQRRQVDPEGDNPLGIALREGRLVAGEGSDDLDGLLDLSTTLAAPLRGRRGIRGVLMADSPFSGIVADGATRLVFDLLADHAGRAVENAERYELLAHEAGTDPLTGLGSRRRFNEQLTSRVGGLREEGEELGLLLIDLDNFKRINDVYGHPVGDRVLVELGRRLSGALRPGEGFRYGGDELAVLLGGLGGNNQTPAMDAKEVLAQMAERIRHQLIDEPVMVEGMPKRELSCSIGAALESGPNGDPLRLLKAADGALLKVKKAGKNKIGYG